MRPTLSIINCRCLLAATLNGFGSRRLISSSRDNDARYSIFGFLRLLSVVTARLAVDVVNIKESMVERWVRNEKRQAQ